MQWCAADAFLVVCQQQQLRTRVSLFWEQPIRLVHLFVSCDNSGFHHWDDKSCSWLFLLGPAPFVCLLCFSAGWRSAYLAGGSAFRLLWFLFVVFCAVDLPSYMTTGVNVGRTRGKKRLRKMRKMSFNCSISLMPVFGWKGALDSQSVAILAQAPLGSNSW